MILIQSHFGIYISTLPLHYIKYFSFSPQAAFSNFSFLINELPLLDHFAVAITVKIETLNILIEELHLNHSMDGWQLLLLLSKDSWDRHVLLKNASCFKETPSFFSILFSLYLSLFFKVL